ncbi:hypothetical protein B0H65DRAFT_174646 [Neurospora tetraspora]|uniref:Uncharacterized protein n=1 Tax=Neurospora tetraspora TaxID=94610 RepID=A0AAE0MTP7_9PEZI|nr:hypothetical protein B0H65DRAFT_174646 [Neurospora tetraspora]
MPLFLSRVSVSRTSAEDAAPPTRGQSTKTAIKDMPKHTSLPARHMIDKLMLTIPSTRPAFWDGGRFRESSDASVVPRREARNRHRASMVRILPMGSQLPFPRKCAIPTRGRISSYRLCYREQRLSKSSGSLSSAPQEVIIQRKAMFVLCQASPDTAWTGFQLFPLPPRPKSLTDVFLHALKCFPVRRGIFILLRPNGNM